MSISIAPLANQLLDFAVEILHSFVRAVAHGVQQRFAFALALLNVLARAQRGLEDFEGGHAPGCRPGGESGAAK